MREVLKHSEKKTLPEARKLAKNHFERNVNQMIKDIREHPVSQELMHPNQYEQSAYITGETKYPLSLFGFIGFYAKSRPIARLVEFIKNPENTKINLNTRLKNGRYEFQYQVPSYEEIKSVTPYEGHAIGSSWVQGIESGIPNISSFMNTKSPHPESRSRRGLQATRNMGRSFHPTRYITQILADFRNRMRRSAIKNQ